MRGAQRKIRDKKYAIPHLETIPQKPYLEGLEYRQNAPYSFKKTFTREF